MPYGPCNLCGATNYPSSMGGPYICPSCDCGVPPDVSRLRRENARLVELIRKVIPSEIAKELCEVQPMPNVDFDELAKDPIWQSYCDRHFKEEK